MDLVEAISELDSSPDLHSARILVLITVFAGEDGEGAIEGLTKLAKLDFLLRYPVMLEKALLAKSRSIKEVELAEHERTSVESQMVRYRFGPWDHRYREFLNILVGKGLLRIHAEGRKVVINLTEKGQSVSENLLQSPEFEDYVRRSVLLKRHFDVRASTLMNFIYDTFPEVLTLRSNEMIPT